MRHRLGLRVVLMDLLAGVEIKGGRSNDSGFGILQTQRISR
ncbi:MAG: hypothetical protein RM347_022535 [Nostoc sp. ChiQUE02]|nr:hypothetical protein [Nostoc sp. ChiQUE02]MDZ8231358.1 hypothetical protein [Nostoc sp. ChiQUE02]